MFNQEQQSIINHGNGPALVLAGPGSGKTTVILNRAKKLSQESNYNSKILVITFTKAAAIEMEDRYKKLSSQRNNVSFGTFHSFFLKIINEDAKFKNPQILNTEEKNKIIRDIYSRMFPGKKIDNFGIELFDCILGKTKSENRSISKSEYKLFKKNGYSKKTVDLLVKYYIDYLREKNNIDFDDMQIICYEILLNNFKILAKFQNIYSHIMIDEFQDSNIIQYEIINLIIKTNNNILVVGDDDQSLYGFRGASFLVMERFKKENIPKVYYLEKNYRSDYSICEFANILIKENKKRFIKKIIPVSKKMGTVEIKTFKNLGNEYKYICKEVYKDINNNIKPQEIAVIYRNNNQGQQIFQFLENQEIKCKITESSSGNGVNLLTMHKSKGLEFMSVYIIDMVEGISPYKKAYKKHQIEEERRMFYVGVTRAKTKLTICIPKIIYGKKQKQSRFITQIKKRIFILF